jgi:hypothetical protein
MSAVDRRRFLTSSLASAASVTLLSRSAHGWADDDSPPQPTAASLLGDAGYDPTTLFLTWHRDPTTTMAVQWIAPESDADKTIKCKAVGGAVEHHASTILRPYGHTDFKVHRAELQGLTPDTEYEFEIAAGSPTYRFRTMPAKATDAIQFISGGDSGVDKHAVANNILAAKQDPRFALVGGDLAYDNGEQPRTFVKYLRNYREHMVDSQGRLIPMISCIGNHEVDGGYRGKRSDSPHYLSVFDGFFCERTFGVFDIGDYLSIVLLDTNHIAPVAGEQTSWLECALKDRQERPHLIVANHVPAYPSHRPFERDGDDGPTGEDQRQHWSPLFERYKVDVVLEHHDHTFKRTHPLTGGMKDANGVLYLGDGSWGKIRPPTRMERRPYLVTAAEAYHITLHRLEGESQYHVALDESGKVADVCLTKSKRPSRRA